MTLLGSITEIYRMRIVRRVINRDMKILDLGCGKGGLVKRLRNEGFDIVGIDPNLPHSSKFLFKQDAYRTKFRDNFFDCIISIESIEHLYPVVYKEVRRISKNNAKLIITTPKKRWNWLIELLSLVGLADPLITPHINVVNPKDVPFKIEKTGSLLLLEWYGIFDIIKN